MKGFVWQAFGQLGQRGVMFVATLVFGRVLSAEQYGLVSFALAFVLFVDVLRHSGVMQAFIAFQGKDEDAQDTVFWMSFTAGVFWTLVLVGVAFALPYWNVSPGLSELLLVLSFSLLIDSFKLVPTALLLRRLRFKENAISESVGVIVGMIVGMICLFVLPKEEKQWAMIIMYLTRSLVSAVAFNFYALHIPKFRFDKSVASPLSRRGMGILSSNFPSSSLDSFTDMMIGFVMKAAPLGYFRLGFNATSPTIYMAHAANNTIFPIIANHQNNLVKAAEITLRAIKSIGLISIGIAAWLFVVSPDLLPLLFVEKGGPSTAVAQLLAFAVFLRGWTFVCTNAMLAVGKSYAAAGTWWITLAVAAGLLLFGLTPASTPEAAALLVLVYSGVSFVAAGFWLIRAFPIRVSEFFRNLCPAVFSAVPACFIGILVQKYSGLEGNHGLRFVVTSLAYVMTFLPFCGLLAGGGWLSLFKVSGWKAMLKAT